MQITIVIIQRANPGQLVYLPTWLTRQSLSVGRSELGTYWRDGPEKSVTILTIKQYVTLHGPKGRTRRVPAVVCNEITRLVAKIKVSLLRPLGCRLGVNYVTGDVIDIMSIHRCQFFERLARRKRYVNEVSISENRVYALSCE